MIAVFGGTTEGRNAVQVIDRAGKPFYYSTKGNIQEVNTLCGIQLSGAMNTTTMMRFCKEKNIRLIVDAAHPFAVQLHQTIADVSEQLQLPVIRYERIYPARSEDIIWCEDYAEAISRLRKEKINRLLALTGVQTIGKLKPFWQHTDTYFRILNREESLTIARNQGFPSEKLLFYREENNDAQLIKALRPDALILKESGTSGKFTEKVAAARENNIRIFAIKHPVLPDDFYTVDGKHGLRRAIEQLLPEFFPLRTGITTGSCATAAAVAALTSLLTHAKKESAIIILPGGEHLSIPIFQTLIKTHGACCTVIKDAGDDADVTNGIAIQADVRLRPSAVKKDTPPEVNISGGEGVGRVTLPGLGLDIGAPAINAAPRNMLTKNLQAVYQSLSPAASSDIEVCISVPDGEEIARRTFNPRLGITGGISIIGTSGIVQPFSIEAFIASIRKSMEVARASGSSRIVINSGAKSERYLRNYYPDLPDTAFVQYGNSIGETLRIAAELNVTCLTLGIMIGKAVKLAEGHLNTHSKKITMNKAFLSALARRWGCSEETANSIGQIALARELWNIIPIEEAEHFFRNLMDLCRQTCKPVFARGELTILFIKEDGEIL